MPWKKNRSSASFEEESLFGLLGRRIALRAPLKKNRSSCALEEESLFRCGHAPVSLPLKKVRSSGDAMNGSRNVSEALAPIVHVGVQRQGGVRLTLYRLFFSRHTVPLPHRSVD